MYHQYGYHVLTDYSLASGVPRSRVRQVPMLSFHNVAQIQWIPPVQTRFLYKYEGQGPVRIETEEHELSQEEAGGHRLILPLLRQGGSPFVTPGNTPIR